MSPRNSLLAVLCVAVALVPLFGPGHGATEAPQATPPLVVVSFDGFRWDYHRTVETPGLDRLAAAGVRAERLIPVFPSKTFPAHYSIVTGLYPGHHGVVSNNMRDPRWPEPFGLSERDQVQDGRWWGGEPIWVSAERQGVRTATYFWPGSEARVQGVRPGTWFAYDGSVSFEERVETALDWLGRPAPERPGLVILYFEEPNEAGHRHGPDAAATRQAARRVDRMLGDLLDGLEVLGLEANVLVVSDHGMARNDPERVIVLEELVELRPGELFEAGAMLQIFPEPGREETIYRALAGSHPHLRVWRPDEIPARFGLYEHPRLPPVLGTPDSGWEVLPRERVEDLVTGDHGQDPQHPDMHGIFYGAGPDLMSGVTLPAVEQVDLYNLMAALLRIEPAPNDGDPARVRGLLR